MLPVSKVKDVSGWCKTTNEELVKIAIGGNGEVSGIGEFGGIFSRNAQGWY